MLVISGALLHLILLMEPQFVLPAQPLFELSHDFKYPSEVAVSKEGLIYVVDGLNHCIKVFNYDGSFAFQFGKRGHKNGDFETPVGIDLTESGKVFIADSGNHRIQVFNSKGHFMSMLDVLPEDKTRSDPTDVVVDEESQVLHVVDNDNHRILSYSLSSWELLSSMGKLGKNKRELNYPFLMEQGPNKSLFVVEAINTRVQVWSPTGKFVMFVGGWGIKKGQFFRPKGIALDQMGHIFVSDSYLGVVQVFDDKGDFMKVVGNPQSTDKVTFKSPMGLFVDHTNRLYVVEMTANKVSVFQLPGSVGAGQ